MGRLGKDSVARRKRFGAVFDGDSINPRRHLLYDSHEISSYSFIFRDGGGDFGKTEREGKGRFEEREAVRLTDPDCFHGHKSRNGKSCGSSCGHFRRGSRCGFLDVDYRFNRFFHCFRRGYISPAA